MFRHRVMPIEGEPYMVHFVRSGFTEMGSEPKRHKWFVFEEDAFEQEPWQSGIKLMSVSEIQERYGVNVEDPDEWKLLPNNTKP